MSMPKLTKTPPSCMLCGRWQHDGKDERMDKERKTAHSNRYAAAWVSTLLVLTAIPNMYERKSPRMVQTHRKTFAYTNNMNKGDWSQHNILGMTCHVPAYDAFTKVAILPSITLSQHNILGMTCHVPVYDAFTKVVILPSITICTSEFSIHFFPVTRSTHSYIQINRCITHQYYFTWEDCDHPPQLHNYSRYKHTVQPNTYAKFELAVSKKWNSRLVIGSGRSTGDLAETCYHHEIPVSQSSRWYRSLRIDVTFLESTPLFTVSGWRLRGALQITNGICTPYTLCFIAHVTDSHFREKL